MRRVLVLSDLWLPFPGGAERFVFNLARDLHRRAEFDVYVVTGYERAQPFDGPPVITHPIGTGENREAGGRCVRALIDNVDPDVILTHHYYASQFEAEIVEQDVPIVQVVHNGPRIPQARFAIYNSRWVMERCDDRQSSDVVFNPPAFDDVAADEHGDGIGFVKPIEHKGVELFYKIAEAMPDRRFVVLRGEWQDIEDVRPLSNVEFVEPVDDMRDFYRLVRLMLVPSRSEDAGTVAQEATINGLPCISSDVGGLAETNGGGRLLNRDDVDAWVATIRSFDDPLIVASVVASQCAHLTAQKIDARLDGLAARIGAL